MRYQLKPLPYDYSALEPIISSQIVTLHHDKHQNAYVNGANQALEKLEKARTGEIEISVKAVTKELSFNLNGVILHELFWDTMQAPSVDNSSSDDNASTSYNAPTSNNAPTGKIADAITKNFGNFEAFKKEFAEGAKTVEGSGWMLLLCTPSGEMITNPVEKHNIFGINGYKPILALDVWEHAYYLDYMNDRGAFVDKWWDLVNWSAVERLM